MGTRSDLAIRRMSSSGADAGAVDGSSVSGSFRAFHGGDPDVFMEHEQLREPEMPEDRVAIFLGDPALRNLVRTDLEDAGFRVVAVGAGAAHPEGADVVVTEFAEHHPGYLTFLVVSDDRVTREGDVIRVPTDALESLGSLVRLEIARRRGSR